MKKFLSYGLAFALLLGTASASQAALFEDRCNPQPIDCYGCAPNKPEVLVKLQECAYKNKPYNYYTYRKVAEKEIPSGRYDWAASPAK